MKKEEGYKKKIINPLLLSILACPRCGNDLQLSSEKEFIVCSFCKTKYPVVEGIPVLFSDEKRREFTVNKEVQDSIIQEIKKLNELKPLYREGLKGKITTEEIESLAWEVFFWRNWEENEDYGTIQFDKKRINDFLARDIEGGGRMRFFDAVRTNESSLTGKILLNVGCGRDFLFEKFQESGAIVIEQDIVLDSLIKLRYRGALGICCDSRRLPIKDNAMDIVTSFVTIHHVHPIEEPLGAISRVLKTKGGFYVNEPNKFAFGTLAKDLTPSFLRIRRMVFKNVKWGRVMPSPYEESINPKQFVSILKNNGFSTIKLVFIPKVQNYIPKPFQFPLSLLLRVFPIFSSHFEVYARKEERYARMPILFHNIHINGLRSLVYSYGLSAVRYIEYNKALNFIKDEKIDNVLDIGSGHSLLPSLMAKEGYDIVTIDRNKDFGIWQRSKVNSNLESVIANGSKLPFKDNSFSAVTCISVLEHIRDGGDLKVIKEILRILKPNGVCVISVPVSKEERIVDDQFYGIPKWLCRILGERRLLGLLKRLNADRGGSYFERFYAETGVVERFINNSDTYLEESVTYWDWKGYKKISKIVPRGAIGLVDFMLVQKFIKETKSEDVGTMVLKMRKKWGTTK